MGPHAEVASVRVEGTSIAVTGAILPPATSADAIVARRRGDGQQVRGELVVASDGSFTATLDVGLLGALGRAAEEWELALVGAGPDLPVARLLDDVPNPREAYVFPAARVAGRVLRPGYDHARSLLIRSRTAPVGRPRRPRPPKPAPRGPAWPARAIGALAGRAARILLRLTRRRGAPAEERVVFVLGNAWGMGGTIRTTLANAGHLARSHRVEVISCFRHRDKPFFDFPEGVMVTVIDDRRPRTRRRRSALLRRLPGLLAPRVDARLTRNWSLWTDLRFLRVARRLGPGLVIGTRPGINLLLTLVRRPGLAVIGQEHINFGSHPTPLQREITKRYRWLDELVVLTERDADAYRSMLGPHPPVTLIPNAAQATSLPPPALERPMVVAAGRLTPQKGFDLLIPAFARVAERHPQWTLRILGSGPRRRQLRRLVVAHDLSNHVTMPGAVPDLPRHLHESSIFVLSSRHEGLPMVLLEAMSEGMPVVSFDCPTGPADVIEHGRSGLLVPPEDVAALAEALCALIEDPARRRALAAGGVARVGERFSVQAVGAHWEALIERHLREISGRR